MPHGLLTSLIHCCQPQISELSIITGSVIIIFKASCLYVARDMVSVARLTHWLRYCGSIGKQPKFIYLHYVPNCPYSCAKDFSSLVWKCPLYTIIQYTVFVSRLCTKESGYCSITDKNCILYCWPDRLSCPASAIWMGRANWAIWAVIKGIRTHTPRTFTPRTFTPCLLPPRTFTP